VATGGGIVAATAYTQRSGSAHEVRTVAWSAAGQRLWAKRIPGATGTYGLDVAVSPKGVVTVAGVFRRTAANGDALIASYSKKGALRWKKYVAGGAGLLDVARAITLDAAGNAYITGDVLTTGTNRDLFVASYKPSGVRRWKKVYDTAPNWNESGMDIAVRGSFVAIAGSAILTTASDPNGGLALRLTTAGALRWATPLRLLDGRLSFSHVGVDAYGHLIAAGAMQQDATNPTDDITVYRFEPAGWSVWDSTWRNDASNQSCAGLAVTAEGDAFATGSVDEGPTGSNVFTERLLSNSGMRWVSRFNGEGNLDDFAKALALGPKGVSIAGSADVEGLVLLYRASATP
jgi:hypothetical protein